MSRRQNTSGALSSKPADLSVKVPGVTTSDDLSKIVQAILTGGGKITITIESLPEPDPVPGETTKARCAECGWQSTRTFKSKKSADRALRAHRPNCKGAPVDKDLASLKSWLEQQ